MISFRRGLLLSHIAASDRRSVAQDCACQAFALTRLAVTPRLGASTSCPVEADMQPSATRELYSSIRREVAMVPGFLGPLSAFGSPQDFGNRG